MNKQLKGSLILLLTALIWGSSFVAQDVGGNSVGPFTFNASRWIVGAITLMPVMLSVKKVTPEGKKVFDGLPKKPELIGGSVCGVILFISSTLQQVGISLYGEEEAAAGKSGFITALYIILVPLFGVFLKKKIPFRVWVSVIIALMGIYFLCITESLKLSSADIFVFLCAVSFTLHILTVDKFSAGINGIKFSAVQVAVCGILSTICMFVLENPNIENILSAAVPILYAGVLSSGVAYTLQIVGQKNTDPTVASVLMSLESVFAAITGAFFGEVLTVREIIGGILMFTAVILAQVDIKKVLMKYKEKQYEIQNS